MSTNPQEIFERYICAGAMTRDPDALAELFTPDGVYEAPLVPEGHAFPRRLAGRAEIPPAWPLTTSARRTPAAR